MRLRSTIARPTIARPVCVGSALLVAAAVVGLTAGPAAASDAGTFVAGTASLRAARGLAAYQVCSDLDGLAAAWAEHMAAEGTLAHNPGLAGEVSGWETLGENVGEGGTASAVQTSFERSPEHLANLLSSSYLEAGYGTARSANGTLWVDEVFRKPSGGSCAGASVPAPVVTHAPVAAPASTPAASRSQVRVTLQPAAPARPARPSAQVLVAQQKAALRTRLASAGKPLGDVVGDALAFAALMQPVR